MQKLFSLIIGLFIFVNHGAAQVTVATQLDSAQILIGDQVDLHLLINHSPNVKIERVDWSVLDQVKEIEIINIKNLDTLAKGQEYVLEQILTLTSFDSGYYFIPPIPVFFKNNDQTGVAKSTQLALMVNPLAVGNDVEIAPIKDIIQEPLKFQDFAPYLGGAALLIAIGFLIAFLIRRSKKKDIPPPPEIVLPPHEIALNKLEDLKKAKLWQQGLVKEYQSKLTYVVREYLENRFKVRALESTTDEVLDQFNSMDIQSSWKEKLGSMLRMADLVKFAKAEPDIEVHARGMGEAEEFILETKQRWQEEPKEEEEEIEEEVEEVEKEGSTISTIAQTTVASAVVVQQASLEEEE